jgi:hypothetical protein
VFHKKDITKVSSTLNMQCSEEGVHEGMMKLQKCDLYGNTYIEFSTAFSGKSFHLIA